MDFSIAPELASLLVAIRAFVDREILPVEAVFLRGEGALVKDKVAAIRAKVKAQGWWAPQLPASVGGMGLSLCDFAHVSEVLGRSILGHLCFNCQAPDAGNMEILLHYGTDEQKERFLMPVIRGEARSCFSMTEPSYPGANPTWMGTKAVRDGESYVIDGRKWFTSSADGAAWAIVMAITDASGGGSSHQKASMLIVPTETPGFRRLRNISVMGDAGEDYASHAEIAYEACRVPVSHLLGEEGAGFLIAQERLGPGRIHHCMRWIGICERAFDLMAERAATREIAPGRPLATRQAVQMWLAESRAEINASRLMVLQAAWKMDREGQYQAREEISVIKFFVADVLQKVLDRAIQIHGALGVTDDTPLAWWFRHERAARIYDGPDEVHKTVVARRIFRKYGLDLH